MGWYCYHYFVFLFVCLFANVGSWRCCLYMCRMEVWSAFWCLWYSCCFSSTHSVKRLTEKQILSLLRNAQSETGDVCLILFCVLFFHPDKNNFIIPITTATIPLCLRLYHSSIPQIFNDLEKKSEAESRHVQAGDSRCDWRQEREAIN